MSNPERFNYDSTDISVSVRLEAKGSPKVVRPCAAAAVSHMYSNSDFDNRIENEATSHFNIEKLS